MYRALIAAALAALGACAHDPRGAANGDWPRAQIAGPHLEDLTRDLRAGMYGNVHAVLAVQNERLVYEEYFEGADERRGQAIGNVQFNASTLHDARSVTKSVVSILFGLAVAQGRITDLDAAVLNYFPEYGDLNSPERRAITLRHLLSMTSGFAWDEGSRPYGDPLNDETAMDAAPDPYRYVLERPIAASPGAHFEYSGGDTMLLAAVIERATGMRLQDFARHALFAPLGITDVEWIEYEGGQAIAASGLRLRPRDMAKIGQMMLDGGRWRGTQIVPETWVSASLSPHVTVSDRPIGLQRYGYQWWLGTARVAETPVPYAMAVGWGGQRILIVPSYNVVIVLNCGLYGDRRQTDLTFEIMLDRLLPVLAVR